MTMAMILLLGDINGDRIINTLDATLISRLILEMTSKSKQKSC